MVKILPANAGDVGSISGLGRSLGEENGKPLLFLPGESHGQTSLVGYSPGDRKRVEHDLATKQQIYSHDLESESTANSV